MRTETAIALINSLVYKPGWTFTAESHSNRFEDCVKVRISYPALNSDRSNAEKGYTDSVLPAARADYPLMVGTINDDASLYRLIIDAITDIEIHEAREFLRVGPSYWAPFHPHNSGGMREWMRTATVSETHKVYSSDLTFGVA